MTCDFCGSFLHLWKDCRDRQEQRNSKKFRTYANMVDEDDEQEEYDEDDDQYEDDETTPESEAFITHHLADLGLAGSSRSRRKKDWKTSNKMIRELKENDVKIKYKKRDCCVLSWRSSKVKRVVSSSYDAEVLALSEGLEEALVLRKLLLDMTRMDPNMLEIEAFCDNEDTIKALNMSKSYYKGKRIGIEVAKIKEMWTKGEVKTIQWVPGQYQLADGLTKKEASRTPILEAIQNGSFMN